MEKQSVTCSPEMGWIPGRLELLCSLVYGNLGRPIVTRQFPDSGADHEEIEVLMQGFSHLMRHGDFAAQSA